MVGPSGSGNSSVWQVFLHQIVQHGGFYRTTDDTWISLERVQFVRAYCCERMAGLPPHLLAWLYVESDNDDGKSDEDERDVGNVCSICLDTYKQPKLLPCFHTFCLDCLLRLLEVDSVLVCPICSEKHELSKSGVAVLPNNFNWSDLGLEKSPVDPGVGLPKSMTGGSGELLRCENGMDSNTAVAFCHDCNCYLCQECLDSHQKMVATRKHSTQLLVEAKQAFTRPRCPTCSLHHGEEIKLYCHDCNVALCRECAISTHRRHNYEYLKDVAAEINERLPILQEILKKQQRELKVRLLEGELLASGEAAINKSCDKIIEIVENHRQDLLTEWKQLVASANSGTRKEIHEQELSKLSRPATFLEKLNTSKNSDVELATMLKPLMKDLESICTHSSGQQSFECFHSVITNGGDMNQLAAQLPRIVTLTPSNIVIHASHACSSGIGTLSIEIYHSWHSLRTEIPLHAVAVDLTTESQPVPCTINSCGENRWDATFNCLTGVNTYEAMVSVLGVQQNEKFLLS